MTLLLHSFLLHPVQTLWSLTKKPCFDNSTCSKNNQHSLGSSTCLKSDVRMQTLFKEHKFLGKKNLCSKRDGDLESTLRFLWVM